MELYNTDQVAELAKINKGTLFHYVKAGAINPVKRGRQGTNRLYDRHNLVEICLIADLIEMGLPKSKIVWFLKNSPKHNKDRMANFMFQDMCALFNEIGMHIGPISTLLMLMTGKDIIVKLKMERG